MGKGAGWILIGLLPGISLAVCRAPAIDGEPAIEALAKPDGGAEQKEFLVVSGYVQQVGRVTFKEGMTVLQAINAAGGINQFGGRDIVLVREGKRYRLDFERPAHMNIKVRPKDLLDVEMKYFRPEQWKGRYGDIKQVMEGRRTKELLEKREP